MYVQSARGERNNIDNFLEKNYFWKDPYLIYIYIYMYVCILAGSDDELPNGLSFLSPFPEVWSLIIPKGTVCLKDAIKPKMKVF